MKITYSFYPGPLGNKIWSAHPYTYRHIIDFEFDWDKEYRKNLKNQSHILGDNGLSDAMVSWLKEHTTCKFRYMDTARTPVLVSIEFETAEMAMHFKMRWSHAD